MPKNTRRRTTPPKKRAPKADARPAAMQAMARIAAAIRQDSVGIGVGSASLCPQGIAVGGWGNPTTGLGIEGQDPTQRLLYTAGVIPTAMTIDKLYTFDWLAGRIVELLTSLSMVRGFKIADRDAKGSAALIRKFERLNTTERFPHGAFQRAVNDGRAYGGALLLKGYALGAPDTPLTPEARAGGIKFFDVFRQHELRVLDRYTDPSDPNFAMPALYEVINAGGQPHPRVGQKFHASRAIRFAGLPLRIPNYGTDLVGDFPEIGISVLTPVLTVLGQYGLAWAAVSNLLQDASIGVMKLAGLVDALGNEEDDIIRDRLQVMQQTKSVNRVVFLDADNQEEYTRTEVKLTDVPAVMQQFMVALSGSAGVPARLFFSSSPSGLNSNASGDADLKQLYNDCANNQTRYLGPKLEDVLTDIEPGSATDEIHVEWPSLWEASDNEKAQTRTAHMNADKVAWDMGYGAQQITKARKAGTYIELLGEAPEDSREDVAGPSPGEDDPAEGAPGAEGAAKIATKQRAAETQKKAA